MCKLKEIHVWLGFFIIFATLSIVSIVVYINEHECDIVGPTISSSLFTQYVQGATIVLFLLGAFAFKSDKESLFVLALILFGFAFIHDDNGVHIMAIMAATGILWLSILHKFYTTWATLNPVGLVLLGISIVCGTLFFIFYFESWSCVKTPEKRIITYENGVTEEITLTDVKHPDGQCNKVPCSPIAWLEYAAFTLLFASTYVLVPDKEFELFEGRTDRKNTSKENAVVAMNEMS